jgi:hypothetical protein
MSFLSKFFMSLAMIITFGVAAVTCVALLVLPAFVPMFFGLTEGYAATVTVGLYIVLGAAFMAACADF